MGDKMITECRTEEKKGWILSPAEVSATLNRATSRLAFVLDDWDELSSSCLRASISDTVDGVITLFSNVWCDLRDLNEQLYPDAGNCWAGPDVSCEISCTMGLISLLLDGQLGQNRFYEEAPDRVVLGVREVLRDVVARLEEMIQQIGEKTPAAA